MGTVFVLLTPAVVMLELRMLDYQLGVLVTHKASKQESEGLVIPKKRHHDPRVV